MNLQDIEVLSDTLVFVPKYQGTVLVVGPKWANTDVLYIAKGQLNSEWIYEVKISALEVY